jgi:hypothetical protein
MPRLDPVHPRRRTPIPGAGTGAGNRCERMISPPAFGRSSWRSVLALVPSARVATHVVIKVDRITAIADAQCRTAIYRLCQGLVGSGGWPKRPGGTGAKVVRGSRGASSGLGGPQRRLPYRTLEAKRADGRRHGAEIRRRLGAAGAPSARPRCMQPTAAPQVAKSPNSGPFGTHAQAAAHLHPQPLGGCGGERDGQGRETDRRLVRWSRAAAGWAVPRPHRADREHAPRRQTRDGGHGAANPRTQELCRMCGEPGSATARGPPARPRNRRIEEEIR